MRSVPYQIITLVEGSVGYHSNAVRATIIAPISIILADFVSGHVGTCIDETATIGELDDVSVLWPFGNNRISSFPLRAKLISPNVLKIAPTARIQ